MIRKQAKYLPLFFSFIKILKIFKRYVLFINYTTKVTLKFKNRKFVFLYISVEKLYFHTFLVGFVQGLQRSMIIY